MAGMSSVDIKDTLVQALCLPDYRDWPLSREIIKARLKLLAAFGMLSLAGAFTSHWVFVLAFPPVLGLALAVGFDVFLAGGIEGGRRLREKFVGVEQVEARRLESLAQLDYSGIPLAPTFIHGPHGGLWLEASVLEQATGKRVAPSLAAELGQARTVARKRWIPAANLARVARGVEPVGQQFFSIWLENTAIPYWSGLELEARKLVERRKA